MWFKGDGQKFANPTGSWQQYSAMDPTAIFLPLILNATCVKTSSTPSLSWKAISSRKDLEMGIFPIFSLEFCYYMTIFFPKMSCKLNILTFVKFCFLPTERLCSEMDNTLLPGQYPGALWAEEDGSIRDSLWRFPLPEMKTSPQHQVL